MDTLSLRRCLAALTVLIAIPSAFAAPSGTSQSAVSAQSGAAEDGANKVRQLLTEARGLLQNEKFEEAIPILETATKYDPNPNSASVHQNLGFLYQKQGKLDKAAEQYKSALAFRPSMHTCTLNLGQCYLGLGNNTEAVRSFQQYIKQAPDSPHIAAVKQMIAALRNVKREDESTTDYLASTAKNGLYRWDAGKLPLKVFIDGGNGVKGAKPSYVNYVTEAFDQWSSASGNRLRWKRVSDRGNADIICFWSDKLELIGQSEDAGHADISAHPGLNGIRVIDHVDVAILTVTRDGKPLPDREVKRTCLHEIGHALGLKEHSPNGSDIMFFSDAPTTAPSLSARDRATISKLYDNYPVTTASDPDDIPRT